MAQLHRIFSALTVIIFMSITNVRSQFSAIVNSKTQAGHSYHFQFPNQDSNASHFASNKGIFIISGALITYGVLSLNVEVLKDWNEAIRDAIWTKNPHSLTNIEDYLQWVPAASVYGLNLVGVKGKNNLRDRTFIYGISMALMGSSVWAIKRISNETRPDGSDQYSFPSGHVANAFVGAEFLRQEYKDRSAWYGIGGYAAAIATGYFRMYNNKHWLGDVIGGAGIGILSTNIAYTVYPAIKKWLFGKKEISTFCFPQYESKNWGIALVHFF